MRTRPLLDAFWRSRRLHLFDGCCRQGWRRARFEPGRGTRARDPPL